MKRLVYLCCEIAVLVLVEVNACLLFPQDKTSGSWMMQLSGTTAGLRGIHAVGGGVAWASGTEGTVLRTEDGGYMWQQCAMPPGAEKLDFRGIWAWDSDTAIVMSSGPGDLSRIYKTTDGCSHWKLMFMNPDKDGFWDAMVFWDREHGEVVGDPVERRALTGVKITTDDGLNPDDGSGNFPAQEAARLETRFAVFVSSDGGQTWGEDEGAAFQNDPKRSDAFAASNSSLVRLPSLGWFGIGGLDGSFVYRGIRASDITSHEGLFWQKIPVPISSGTETSGVFSLDFRGSQHGVAVGGNYKKPNESAGTAAWTADGGEHWTATVKPPHGYRSAVAWDADAKAWIAAGTNGSDISYDDGRTWAPLDYGNWNALSLPWVVGPQGRIAKLDESKLPRK
jgi:photosystem II stability/assembly factor-like uncharacterized protein